jgi:F0F1-type ATP synthase delta subunit
MPISARHYAKALFEVTAKATKPEAKLAVDRLFNELKSNNALSQAKSIIAEFENLSDASEGIVRATITSARPLSKTALKEAESLVLKRSQGQTVVWNEVIDEDILGGAIIAYEDSIIDLSLADRVSGLAARIKE